MLFIAEIGLNHNGNLDLACELIRQAKWSGADVVKMQLGWRGDLGEINYIDNERLKHLLNWAEFVGVELAFSLFTEEAFQTIKQHPVKRYKIASRTIKDNPKLVQRIVDEGRETIISLGMWDGKWLPTDECHNVKYLWCKAVYPAYPNDLKDLPKDFNGSIFSGYSDHSLGIEVPLLAVSRGAQIIEKHFTLDKSDKTIRDHVLSATPEEFRTMVNLGKSINNYISIGV